MINVSSKIIELYKSKGFSIRSLADEIGMSRNGLHNLLKTGDFKLSTLNKIADVLQVNISEFFYSNFGKEKEVSLFALDGYQKIVDEKLYKVLNSTLIPFSFYNGFNEKEEYRFDMIFEIVKELKDSGFFRTEFWSAWVFEQFFYNVEDTEPFKKYLSVFIKMENWIVNNYYNENGGIFKTFEEAIKLNLSDIDTIKDAAQNIRKLEKITDYSSKYAFAKLPDEIKNELKESYLTFTIYMNKYLPVLLNENSYKSEIFKKLDEFGLLENNFDLKKLKINLPKQYFELLTNTYFSPHIDI